MSKAPLSLVSRCRPAPSSPPRRATLSTAPPAPRESKVLAALGGFSLSELNDTIYEAYVSPRITLLISSLCSNSGPRNKPSEVHPFFRRAATATPVPRPAPRLKPAATKKSTLVRISPPKALHQAQQMEPATSQVPLETAPPDVEMPAAEEEAAPKVAPALPVYSYLSLEPAPTMRFTRTEADADKWIQELDHTGPISMDCEWEVVFRKGGTRPVSVIQVADKKNILVIQLRTKISQMTRFPIQLQQLLENPDIPKMGANIMNDANKMYKDYGVMTRNVVELGLLARQADPSCKAREVFGDSRTIVALAKLVERYLQKTLRKEADIRCSKWEGINLSEDMLEYAANDAYCGLEVYNHLISLAKANEIELDAAKYTKHLHHEHLVPPSTPENPPSEVPYIVWNDDMKYVKVSPNCLRIYRHWRGQWPIDVMAKQLAAKPGKTLERSTIVSYVVLCIDMLFMDSFVKSDLKKLRLLLQEDLGSWERHSEFFSRLERFVLKK
ncbi:ribonuclease H-like domain-containing protein [Mycena maculata]|uniref:Ribonuclease H-like domain-containing protein n=1 Tax=Mycena maculata TaxID=230809 RepID=A0AAD7MLJ4_9AGAR|nr:ribonuclease H-like domain-containing protein [Mycena maculata]